MSVIMDGFLITTKENIKALELFKKNNMVGYITFRNKKDEIKTQEIKIESIKDVFNSDNGKLIDTFISYSYTKKYEKKILFIFKIKHIQTINVESGFYSKDFYSEYAPYGMLPLEIVKLNRDDSINFYFDNVELSNQYGKHF